LKKSTVYLISHESKPKWEKGIKVMANIGAIILAAGMSKRMGQPKLFLSLNHKPIFRYAVEVAATSHLKPIVVVGGEHVHQLETQLKDIPDVEILRNAEYRTGMASSVKLGIEAVTGRTEAVLIFLADQPCVPKLVIETLVDTFATHRSKGIRIVRPEYAGAPGHPILFDAELYHEFQGIQGDEGGRSIIQRYRSCVKFVSFEEALWGMDIDTPEDFHSVKKVLNPE
jgi:molybdenum cofactor cytidylyltransferase